MTAEKCADGFGQKKEKAQQNWRRGRAQSDTDRERERGR